MRSSCAVLLAVVTFGAACHVTAPVPNARPVSAPGVATPTPATATLGALPEPAGPSLVLERTACFGDCPVYRLELHRSGVAIFVGDAHTTQWGEARGPVVSTEVERLVAAFESLDLAALPSAPGPACATDFPAIAITLRRDDRVVTRQVDSSLFITDCDDAGTCGPIGGACVDRLGLDREALLAFDALSNEIDRVARASQWIDNPRCRALRSVNVPEDPPTAEDVARERALGLDFGDELAVVDPLVQQLRREPTSLLRLRLPFTEGAVEVAEAYRKALAARGVPADRLVVQIMTTLPFDWRGRPTLTIGPRDCMGAALADEAAWSRWLREQSAASKAD